ncbi:hypothetical protein HDU91_003316 [Kappamyces sp. JEL0680]|nr:hypothetical protein HDU91_003316 [Kappamyces sp. JEL0680]
MSWKGFTKAINRLPAMIAKSTGASQSSVDEEFNHLEAQFKLVDVLARKLGDDTRKFKDSLSLMLYHQAELAHLFTNIYMPLGVDPALNNPAEHDANIRSAMEFASAMNQAKESLQGDLQQLERLVVAPTTDFIAILDHIKRILVKRSHKLLDYDRHGENLKTLRDKPNPTASDAKKVALLQATFDQASLDYNNINHQIKTDLTTFLEMRKDFIDPCLLTFYFYQVRVYDTLYRIYYQVGSSQFDLSSTALAGYQSVQEELLAMLNSLTICKAIARPTGGSSSDVIPGEAGPGTSMVGGLAPSYTDSVNRKQSTANTRASYDGPPRNLAPPPTNTRASLDTKRANYVVALYDFEAQAEGDLSFRKDERIEVLEMKEDINDWWTGRTADGRVGVFPGNYTTPL